MPRTYKKWKLSLLAVEVVKLTNQIDLNVI